ncbi:cobalamin biosynthesis protein [Pontibaca methylaminivorans]|uniref:Cobalt-precorrin 5A hydrolase n=1 Tax=Pontibaca methylaminivorans TaxID=515897 RepID=A0A1R3WCC7_9RHOB|nr:cobalamin biosynthesis protein [Pontibaca methylaminivorans]SIT75553.1 cobalt-precorrin 5A hydrolase [Pontibaca methylaminivorans]
MSDGETAMRTIAGLGFREAAHTDSLRDALARARAQGVRTLAVPADKIGHRALRPLAAAGYRVIGIVPAVMQAVPTLTESPAARRAYQTGSVAEACALAAARAAFGPRARLAGPRAISGDRLATAALALAPEGDPE